MSDSELFYEHGIDLFPVDVVILADLDPDMIAEHEEERAAELAEEVAEELP